VGSHWRRRVDNLVFETELCNIAELRGELGSAQVAANEDALEQLNEEKSEDVENGLPELEFLLGCIQFLQN
jgi:hypothetical protein